MSAVRTANFKRYHLIASNLSLKAATTIEQEIDSSPEDEQPTLKENYISFCSSSIVSSVAALEANINEIFNHRANQINPSTYICNPQIFNKYEWLNDSETFSKQLKFKPSIFPKYDIFAFLLTGKFISHNIEKENIEYAISLRNALVHFTPEREDQLATHKKINNSRKNRFKLSPIYGDEHILFPHRIICTDCAIWCKNIANSFIDSFNSTYIS